MSYDIIDPGFSGFPRARRRSSRIIGSRRRRSKAATALSSLQVAEVSATMRLGELAGLGQASQAGGSLAGKVTEAGIFINQIKAWAKKNGDDLDLWANALAVRHSLGAASCIQIRRYNTKAIAFWGFFNKLTKTIKEAKPDIRIPDTPQMPTLFAHSARVSFTGGRADRIIANLICDAKGFPKKGLIIGTPCREPVGPELGDLGDLDAVWVAPLISALTTVAIITAVTVGAKIILPEVRALIESLTGADKERLQLEMAELNFRIDMVRSSEANRCASLRIKPDMTLDQIQAVYNDCDVRAKEKFPEAAPIEERSGIIGTLVTGAVIIGGLFFASKLLSRRDSVDGLRGALGLTNKEHVARAESQMDEIESLLQEGKIGRARERVLTVRENLIIVTGNSPRFIRARRRFGKIVKKNPFISVTR